MANYSRYKLLELETNIFFSKNLKEEKYNI